MRPGIAFDAHLRLLLIVSAHIAIHFWAEGTWHRTSVVVLEGTA